MAAGKVLEATDVGIVPTQTSCGWHTVGGAVTPATQLSPCQTTNCSSGPRCLCGFYPLGLLRSPASLAARGPAGL